MAECECGCGTATNGSDFVPGHDQKLRTRLEGQVGGVLPMRVLVEAAERYATGDASEKEVLAEIRKVFSKAARRK